MQGVILEVKLALLTHANRRRSLPCRFPQRTLVTAVHGRSAWDSHIQLPVRLFAEDSGRQEDHISLSRRSGMIYLTGDSVTLADGVKVGLELALGKQIYLVTNGD